jgi:hypothetical protein
MSESGLSASRRKKPWPDRALACSKTVTFRHFLSCRGHRLSCSSGFPMKRLPETQARFLRPSNVLCSEPATLQSSDRIMWPVSTAAILSTTFRRSQFAPRHWAKARLKTAVGSPWHRPAYTATFEAVLNSASHFM